MTLLERIEQAEGPSRELDDMIQYWHLGGIGTGLNRTGPAYTASIDAALTLLDGWARLAINYTLCRALAEIAEAGLDPIKALPRFICAAALRARGLV